MTDRRLPAFIVVASLFLLGAVGAQYNPAQGGHPLNQVYGVDSQGNRFSVDANGNGLVDTAENALTTTTTAFALAAQMAGSLVFPAPVPPPPGGGPMPPPLYTIQTPQVLTRGCVLALPKTSGTSSIYQVVPLTPPNPVPPASCIDGVCHIILREIPTSPGVVDHYIFTYYQNGDGYWVSDGVNPVSSHPLPSINLDGKNGDATSSSLVPVANYATPAPGSGNNNILLVDDSTAETSATQLSLLDSSTTHDAEVWVCSS